MPLRYRDQRGNRPVFVGLAISVVFHLGALIPGMILVMGAVTPHNTLEAHFDPKAFRKPDAPPPPPEDQVELGIEEQTRARMTWIGYDEYQEQLALQSETEQAQFTETPGQSTTSLDAGETTPNPITEPTPAAAEAQPVAAPSRQGEGDAEQTERPRPRGQATEDAREAEQPTSTEPAPAVEAEPLEQENTESPAPDPSDPQSLQLPTDPTATPLSPPVEEEPLVGPLPPPALQETHDVPDDLPPEPADAAAEGPPAPDTARQEQTTEARPAQEPQPEATPAASSAGDRPGDVSDQESDATSTVEVPLDKIKLGKPLAAHGLEVKPRRPEFTTLMKLTASPGNPLVEIRFRGNGRPLEALILETSGNPGVDAAIRASLYRWRARGEALSKLKEEETVNIRLRILLVSRR